MNKIALLFLFLFSTIYLSNAQVSQSDLNILKTNTQKLKNFAKTKNSIQSKDSISTSQNTDTTSSVTPKVDYQEVLKNPEKYLNKKITMCNILTAENYIIGQENSGDYQNKKQYPYYVYLPYLIGKKSLIIYCRKYPPNRWRPNITNFNSNQKGILIKRDIDVDILNNYTSLLASHNNITIEKEYYVFVDELSTDFNFYETNGTQNFNPFHLDPIEQIGRSRLYTSIFMLVLVAIGKALYTIYRRTRRG